MLAVFQKFLEKPRLLSGENLIGWDLEYALQEYIPDGYRPNDRRFMAHRFIVRRVRP